MQETMALPISQSLETEVTLLQSKVENLSQRIEEANIVVGYLVTANFELTQDMAAIYKTLCEVVNVIEDDSFNTLNFPFNDDPDDDLLN
tara:strand:+ start:737 stop:1003 length:267 start_codon:yes stop_codon:yes gene_type:complete